MFDVTIYTDVLESEALDGIAGFNFMAESPGVTGADRAFIKKEGVQHLVKSDWHLTHRTEEEQRAHPPSCRYQRYGERFYLSRGRSLGFTLTAPRPGNQLTQTIVTSLPDDFAPYRPAQLFSASQWDLNRAGEKKLPAWPTPLEIDPSFEPEELKADLVDDSPFGPGFLPVFLTMIEQVIAPSRKKLILVHTDLDVVMRYIALGSTFIDAERALDVTFAALVDNALGYVADIVGTTPVFGAVPDANAPGASYNVVNLLNVEMTPVEVSESAAIQAQWFSESDPVDALAAIDIARRWESALGSLTATAAAGLVTMPTARGGDDRSAVALRALAGLAGTRPDDLMLYADELLDPVVTSPLDSPEHLVLAVDAISAVSGAGQYEVATGVLVPTLEALVGRPDLIGDWVAAWQERGNSRERLQWESAEDRRYALKVQSEMLNKARAEDLLGALRIAGYTDLLPDEPAISSALDNLCTYLCHHPEFLSEKPDLPSSYGFAPRLGGRLAYALDNQDEAIAESLASGQWNWLGQTGSRADAWFEASRIATLEPDLRADEVARVGQSLPPAAWQLICTGLTPITGARVVQEWISVRPRIPDDFSQWLRRSLLASDIGYDDGVRLRRVISAMLEAGATTQDGRLQEFLSEVERTEQLFDNAYRESASASSPALSQFAARVRRLLPFFTSEVGQLLVLARDARGVRRLDSTAGDWAHRCVVDALSRMERRSGGVVAVEHALALYESGSDGQSRAATDFLVGVSDSRGGRQYLEEIRDQLSPSWIPILDSLIDEAKKGRMARNLIRGGKRLFGKEH